MLDLLITFFNKSGEARHEVLTCVGNACTHVAALSNCTLVFPCRLEDLVAHEDIINILMNLIDSDNLPHLLFYGPPGTGKVSHSASFLVESVAAKDAFALSSLFALTKL